MPDIDEAKPTPNSEREEFQEWIRENNECWSEQTNGYINVRKEPIFDLWKQLQELKPGIAGLKEDYNKERNKVVELAKELEELRASRLRIATAFTRRGLISTDECMKALDEAIELFEKHLDACRRSAQSEGSDK